MLRLNTIPAVHCAPSSGSSLQSGLRALRRIPFPPTAPEGALPGATTPLYSQTASERAQRAQILGDPSPRLCVLKAPPGGQI